MELYRVHFEEKESDITIISESKQAIDLAKETYYYHRNILEEYGGDHPEFLKSLIPVKPTCEYQIIKLMSDVSITCDVGPMAAVAGAFADLMLESMKKDSEVEGFPAKVALVENGGEIAIDSIEPMKIGLFGGYNPLNFRIGFLIKKEDCPIGIATSSATVGHALSLGQADAVTVFTNTACLADAAATAIGNVVKGKDVENSIEKGLNLARIIPGVNGVMIVREDKIGKYGKIPEFFNIKKENDQIINML